MWTSKNALRRVVKSNSNATPSATAQEVAAGTVTGTPVTVTVPPATNVTPAPPAPTSPSFPPYPYPFPTGFMPATPNAHMYPPPSYFAPYMHMMPPFISPFATPSSSAPVCDVSHGTKRTFDVRSSSPTIGSGVISTEEFCTRYGFSDNVLAGLKELDFVPGDKLSVVTDKEYMRAGFTTLSWQHVVRANKEYVSSLSTLR